MTPFRPDIFLFGFAAMIFYTLAKLLFCPGLPAKQLQLQL
jgi:hypothetical protein